MLRLVCMDVGYTVVMSVGRVSSVKVRSEKNGVGETIASVHGCRVYSRYECRPGFLSQGTF